MVVQMKRELLPGMQYEDPEGIWEIVEICGNDVTVRQIQEGSLNLGQEYSVTLDEVIWYRTHDYTNW